MSRYTTRTVSCDECDAEIMFLESESPDEGMVEQGWERNSGYDYCPDCRHKLEADAANVNAQDRANI